MKLIADSGSTKTHWAITDKEERKDFYGRGINPVHMTAEEIEAITSNDVATEVRGKMITDVYFYGAGCAGEEKNKRVADALKKVIETKDVRITVESDMTGACRSLMGDEAGICGILGTGSNSCLYDGEKIVENVPALGYILGDEGSGAVIGRRLVGDILKHQATEELEDLFQQKYGLTNDEIITAVYRQPGANRYLAQFTKFITETREEDISNESRDYMTNLLSSEFGRFFRRNIMQYPQDYAVNLTGSIAYTFRDEITDVANLFGYEIGEISQEPMDGLIERLK